MSLFMKKLPLFALFFAFFAPANAQTQQVDLRARAAHVKTLLAEKWLPFWFDLTQTPNGAFQFGDGLPIVSLSAQSQMIWTFARAHRDGYSTPTRDYLGAARRGYNFLRDKMRDQPNGGFFAHTNLQGAPHTLDKDTLAHAFVVLALVEFARASGESEPRALATQIWRILRDKAADKLEGGYFGAFSRDWKTPTYSAWNLKSGHVHLQLLSASAELFDFTRDQSIKRDLLKLLDLNEGRFFPKETENTVILFTANWKPVSNSELAIRGILLVIQRPLEFQLEASGRIVRARQILGERAEWVAFGRRVGDAMRVGWDAQNGAILVKTPWKEQPPTYPWKIQYETLSALTVAAKWIPEQTQRPAQIALLLDFLENQATDKADFVAFEATDEAGKVSDATKASLGKAAYFDGRALMDFVAAFEGH